MAVRKVRPARPIPVEPLRQRVGREAVEQLHARALRFATRGVVHRLNNELALFSSHAQLLDLGARDLTRPAARGREARALQDAVTRSRRVLLVVEQLAAGRAPLAGGERAATLRPDPLCLGSELRPLAETLLCENGDLRYPVRVQAEPQIYARVARAALLVVVLLLVEQLVEDAPLPGEIRIEIVTGPCVEVYFAIAADHLPFRVRLPRPDSLLVRFAKEHGMLVGVAGDHPRYRIDLPGDPPDADAGDPA